LAEANRNLGRDLAAVALLFPVCQQQVDRQALPIDRGGPAEVALLASNPADVAQGDRHAPRVVGLPIQFQRFREVPRRQREITATGGNDAQVAQDADN
jgi:hypothetical protein